MGRIQDGRWEAASVCYSHREKTKCQVNIDSASRSPKKPYQDWLREWGDTENREEWSWAAGHLRWAWSQEKLPSIEKGWVSESPWGILTFHRDLWNPKNWRTPSSQFLIPVPGPLDWYRELLECLQSKTQVPRNSHRPWTLEQSHGSCHSPDRGYGNYIEASTITVLASCYIASLPIIRQGSASASRTMAWPLPELCG